MTYNATVYRSDLDGNPVSVFVAEATPAGVMLRSNAVQCTGLEGTPAYDLYLRGAFTCSQLRVVLDGTQGYRDFLRGLALPPAYQGEQS